jgi:hypothetical protein
MHNYQLIGVVLPERAQISFGHPFHVQFAKGVVAMTVSVINNQVAVWVNSPWAWDIHDLRNTVASHLTHQLSVAGYLTGNAYDLEITRVTAPHGAVDYVYGIDIPCIAEKMRGKFSPEAYNNLLDKTTGPLGLSLLRCFTDLTLAMKHPMDTAFYCYRAIEALRQHCGARHQIEGKKLQWPKFREILGIDEIEIAQIRDAAEGVRHGEVVPVTNEQRAALLTQTWGIVEKYLDALPLQVAQ